MQYLERPACSNLKVVSALAKAFELQVKDSDENFAKTVESMAHSEEDLPACITLLEMLLIAKKVCTAGFDKYYVAEVVKEGDVLADWHAACVAIRCQLKEREKEPCVACA